MPTPVQAFAEIAAKHGGVDASDMEAVRRFYRDTLPTLEEAEILQILQDLLAREGAAKGERPEPSYPEAAECPTLRASPPVPLPLLALGWRALSSRFLRRR